jgi:hypothetical protein
LLLPRDSYFRENMKAELRHQPHGSFWSNERDRVAKPIPSCVKRAATRQRQQIAGRIIIIVWDAVANTSVHETQKRSVVAHSVRLGARGHASHSLMDKQQQPQQQQAKLPPTKHRTRCDKRQQLCLLQHHQLQHRSS